MELKCFESSHVFVKALKTIDREFDYGGQSTFIINSLVFYFPTDVASYFEMFYIVRKSGGFGAELQPTIVPF